MYDMKGCTVIFEKKKQCETGNINYHQYNMSATNMNMNRDVQCQVTYILPTTPSCPLGIVSGCNRKWKNII